MKYRWETPLRYALVNSEGRFFRNGKPGGTMDHRDSSYGYTREYAENLARLNPGHRVVAVNIGDYRCWHCNGWGWWMVGPDDAAECSTCDGHGWITRKKVDH